MAQEVEYGHLAPKKKEKETLLLDRRDRACLRYFSYGLLVRAPACTTRFRAGSRISRAYGCANTYARAHAQPHHHAANGHARSYAGGCAVPLAGGPAHAAAHITPAP